MIPNYILEVKCEFLHWLQIFYGVVIYILVGGVFFINISVSITFLGFLMKQLLL